MDVVRYHLKMLARKLEYAPAVVILGPRQVGKTTLAKQYANQKDIAAIYLDLESPNDLQKLKNDPESYLELHEDKLVILDEVQMMPEIFSILRSVIDRKRVNGRFILLGSAMPQLIEGVTESLAGRISYIDLPGFRIDEIISEYPMDKHWINGAFPRAFLSDRADERKDWLQSYVRSYIERDLNQIFDFNFNVTLIRRLWSMIAHISGNLLNTQSISRSLGISRTTTSRYLDYMEAAFLIRRLPPYYTNLGKRLVKSPKLYIRDSGVLHHFHDVYTRAQLYQHPVIGASWEGYVVEQIVNQLSSGQEAFFYRTQVGAEIDFLITKNGIPSIAIEIKNSNTPSLSRGFFTACDDLNITTKYVITPHSDTFFMRHKTKVMSLERFIMHELPSLSYDKTIVR